MPDRIIRESICTSETLNQLSDFEERFWHRLTVNCDDYGRFDARPAILRGRLFPLMESKTLTNIFDALTRLASVGLVYLYEVDGKPFLQVVTWEKHQRVRAQRSKYPAPPADSCGHLPSSAVKCARNPIQSVSNAKCESENAHAREMPRAAYGSLKNVWLSEGELSGLYNDAWEKSVIDAAIEWYSLYKQGRADKPWPGPGQAGDYANIRRYAIKAALEDRARGPVKAPASDEERTAGMMSDIDALAKLTEGLEALA